MYSSTKNANEEFLLNMIHEIRTPLSIITGMCEIAAHHIGDERKIENCLSKINVAGAHLAELINDMLEIGRLENGNVQLKDEIFDIRVLILELKSMIEAAAEEKQILFDVCMDVKNYDVAGDYRRVMQILMNIASNAVKYTQESGSVQFCIEEIRGSRDVYRFVCKDNGFGMSEEFLKHIFEPFSRAEDERICDIKGTGLGMSITQKLVKMMGGNIYVESVIGRGTKVTVELPLKRIII